jgi:lysophospholipase L1-like esterase
MRIPRRRRRQLLGFARAVTVVAAVSALVASLLLAAPSVWASLSHEFDGTSYQLSLGDSLAAGVGASTDALGYPDQIAAAESSSIPDLQVKNLACAGATTGSMLDGPGCSYATGTQMGDAEAFLRDHPGSVRYITLDIGINNIGRCYNDQPVLSPACVPAGLSDITSQLPAIVRGLQTAAPGVPIFGMDSYDPFLADWVGGGTVGAQVAEQIAPVFTALNSALTQTYGAAGAIPVDVQGSFASQDSALTGRWDAATVPQNVARICRWTHMCDGSALSVHANDAGHTLIAGDFEQAIGRWQRGGGRGTWLVDAAGGVHTLGDAPFFGSMAGQRLDRPIVTMAATQDGNGYWLVASDGGIFAFGDAGYFGSTGGLQPTDSIVDFTPTRDDRGYWEVASDGRVFAFGDAPNLGSVSAATPHWPVVGMAQTGSDQGYWLVASDGSVFAFGDAGHFGAVGDGTLHAPVVGMAATADGNGYWLVAADGGVVCAGDAVFHGSTGGVVLARPIVGMTVAPDGYGYTLAASDGGLFNGGSATFNGSLGGAPLPAPIVAVVST